MDKKIHILGISGSLRNGSYNRELLVAASEMMPEGIIFEFADISQIPLYNEDDYSVAIPDSVLQLKDQIRRADGIVIATPEYNRSIPGVLKNVIDWASRPRNTQPFSGKPLAILGAGGRSGTVGAQGHLKQIAAALGMQILLEPEVAIQRAWEKFDGDGKLVDENTRQLIKDQMAAFNVFILSASEKEIMPGVPV
jgi:chromate reductase